MSKVQAQKTITPQMIETGYQMLPQFRKDIEKAVKKFVKYAYEHDDGFGIADFIMNKVLEKFPDDAAMLDHDKLLSTYEYLFGYFNSPQELVAMHDYELSPGNHYCDAYIRVMVKGKKIWVENWTVCDDAQNISAAYEYNMSIGITEDQREKLYGKNTVNLYNVDTQQYSFDEDLCD